MAAYRDGNDARAFECLYRRHRGGLYRYLLRQCATAALAEELFQDVWLNVIRAKQAYVAEARFATYLYRVAHNRLVDLYRRYHAQGLEIVMLGFEYTGIVDRDREQLRRFAARDLENR